MLDLVAVQPSRPSATATSPRSIVSLGEFGLLFALPLWFQNVLRLQRLPDRAGAARAGHRQLHGQRPRRRHRAPPLPGLHRAARASSWRSSASPASRCCCGRTRVVGHRAAALRLRGRASASRPPSSPAWSSPTCRSSAAARDPAPRAPHARSARPSASPSSARSCSPCSGPASTRTWPTRACPSRPGPRSWTRSRAAPVRRSRAWPPTPPPRRRPTTPPAFTDATRAAAAAAALFLLVGLLASLSLGSGRLPRARRATTPSVSRRSFPNRRTGGTMASMTATDLTTSTATAAHIEATERYAAHNYHPLPVVLAEGDGAWVIDVDGRRYLDCLAGYSALNFGHSNERLVAVAREQLGRLTLTSRAFFNDQLGGFAEALCRLTGKDMILPMNSGAEAVETAIKVSRKWGYEVKGVPAGQASIVTMEGNFHGRTTTIVSFSDDEVATVRLRAVHLRLPPRGLRRHRRGGRGHRRDHRRGALRADPGRGRRRHAARGLPARPPRAVHRAQRADGRRRDPVRPGPLGQDLRLRPRGRRPRHLHHGQGPRWRHLSPSPRSPPTTTSWTSSRPGRTARPSAATRWRPPSAPRSSRCSRRAPSRPVPPRSVR